MSFYRDTWIEVDLDAIYDNLSQIKQHYAKTKKIFAVVKADAYGHGAIMVAKTAIKAGADYLAVATLDEAIELRIHKIKVPILVLGNINLNHIKLAAKYDITVTVHQLKWLEKIRDYRGKRLKLQLKLDTGMHRIGLLSESEVEAAYRIISSNPCLFLTGVYTHLATAEEPEETYYQQQFNRFKELIRAIDTRNLVIHIANSAATVKYADDLTNAVRVGLMMYGLLPREDLSIAFSIRQAISLFSRIIQCKQLAPGERISYNGIYQTQDYEWIGTLPIGYADGLDRRMVGGEVYVDGHYCPIVGKICMDQTMIKLPKPYEEGTMVEIIGPHISVDAVAQRINTINYQAVCLLSDRIPRMYKFHNQIIFIQNRRLSK